MRILVTGGSGFLGAWLIRRLAQEGHAIRVLDPNRDASLAAAIAGPDAAASVDWRQGSVAESADVAAAAEGCDGIAHLAGLLTPACRADPLRGAAVNLLGTLNVFAAARAQGIARVAYASSAAVFGPTDGNAPRPITQYGAFKLACEGSAQAWWADHGLASIGFRPAVVYGPGRETGLTAAPTLACRAAAEERPYTMGYSGASGLVFVDDVAAAFAAALRREPDGAHVFNLGGETVSCDVVVAEIRRLLPEARIGIAGPPLPFAPVLAADAIADVLPGLPRTALPDGIARTIAFYRGPA